MPNLHKKAQVYIEKHINEYHRAQLASLNKLDIKKILKRKNPYLFKAKNLQTAESVVRALTDAHLSSHEETTFGNFLERLAIHMNETLFQGRKSTTDGIDLEFDKFGHRYIVTIKSGPNWANSSQTRKMIDQFNTARKVANTSGGAVDVVAVEGICYGRVHREYKAAGHYYRYCGQRFWEFITGDNTFYITIIEPLAYKAKEKNELFQRRYAQKINLFTSEFLKSFCSPTGEVDWVKLVKYNSAIDRDEWKRIG